MADTAATLVAQAKQRVAEIDKELEGVETLKSERALLQKIITAGDPTTPARGQRGRSTASSNGNRSTGTGKRTPSGRAPRGANRDAVLAAVRAKPGSKTGEILKAARIEKRVGYTTISKLTKDGVVKRDSSGGLTLA